MKINLYNSLVGIILLVSLSSTNAFEIIVANSTELQNAINNVQGGDTITLLNANYGALTISEKK